MPSASGSGVAWVLLCPGDPTTSPPTPATIATAATTSLPRAVSPKKRTPITSSARTLTASAGWTIVIGTSVSAVACMAQPPSTQPVPRSQRGRVARRLMSDALSDSSSGACRASTDWSVTPTL